MANFVRWLGKDFKMWRNTNKIAHRQDMHIGNQMRTSRQVIGLYMGHRGFTLIELLVVIAIIALLVSILMPSLTKAKELAMVVVCESNLKGIGTGTSLYLHDYDEFSPFGDIWPNILGDYGIFENKGYITEQGWAKTIISCPSFEQDRIAYGTHFGGSYIMNSYISGLSWDPAYEYFGKRFAALAQPAQSIYIQEGRGASWYIDQTLVVYGPIFYNSLRHDEKSNVLYADMHVEGNYETLIETPVDAVLDLRVPAWGY